MEKKFVSMILLALIVGIGAGYSLGYVTYQPQMLRLQSEISALRGDYDDLNATYNELRTSYEQLLTNYTFLKNLTTLNLDGKLFYTTQPFPIQLPIGYRCIFCQVTFKLVEIYNPYEHPEDFPGSIVPTDLPNSWIFRVVFDDNTTEILGIPIGGLMAPTATGYRLSNHLPQAGIYFSFVEGRIRFLVEA